MKKNVFVSSLLFFTACSTLDSAKKVQAQGVWAEQTPAEILLAVEEYESHKKLPNGLIYGSVARELNLAAKSPRDIEAYMATQPCKKNEDFLREPKTKEPKICNGLKIPQIVYDCQEGSLLRLKPKGDLCSKFRPQAHAVKAVRYPFDANYSDFSKEAFKLDKDANALPKNPEMLNPAMNADVWGDRVHTNF